MNVVNSGGRSVNSGIPQGSNFGPILLFFFINDRTVVLICLAKFYADNAKIYSMIKSVNDELRLRVIIYNEEL